MTEILIVGASDTGRAPMATALLRRMIEQRGLGMQITSAGVLGHDGAPPEQEARAAMLTFGLNIDGHRARSATDELINAAHEVVAIDSGTARALRSRFPAAQSRIRSLGELAGRSRDMPDPFRMQVGAWITYARELEDMLAAALDNGRLSMSAGSMVVEHNEVPPTVTSPSVLPRVLRVLDLLIEMPELVKWDVARTYIEAAINSATQPRGPTDLAPSYGGLLRAVLALSASPPKTGQAVALRAAFARLEQPISANDLTWLSVQIAGWAMLE